MSVDDGYMQRDDIDRTDAADADQLRLLAQDELVEVRRDAIDELCEFGPVSWDEIQQWTLDIDPTVRERVLSHLASPWSAAGKFCAHDKSPCVELLHKVLLAYPNTITCRHIYAIAMSDPAWLDLIWEMIEQTSGDEPIIQAAAKLQNDFEEELDWRLNHPDHHVWGDNDSSVIRQILRKHLPRKRRG